MEILHVTAACGTKGKRLLVRPASGRVTRYELVFEREVDGVRCMGCVVNIVGQRICMEDGELGNCFRAEAVYFIDMAASGSKPVCYARDPMRGPKLLIETRVSSA